MVKIQFPFKNLENGDGLWESRRIILGQMLGGIERSIKLLKEKMEQMVNEIKNLRCSNIT